MAIVQVDVKEHYDTGEIWIDAENETAALQEARAWADQNEGWELLKPVATRGADGRFKFQVEREYPATDYE